MTLTSRDEVLLSLRLKAGDRLRLVSSRIEFYVETLDTRHNGADARLNLVNVTA